MTSPQATRKTAGVLLVAAIAAAALASTADTAWATPTPSPSPEILPSPPQVNIGFGDWIIKQINGWFANLVASAIKPLLDALAETLLITPDVSASGRVLDLWKVTAAMADSAFVLLATIGAITAMGHQSVQTRYAVKEVLPRLAMAILASNTSFLICGKIIEVGNALSKGLLGQDFDDKRAAAQIRMLILPPSDFQIFYTLLALVAIILVILLLISFVMRSALVLLLVVAAPLALACHALPHTDGLARFWWRAFTGLLVIQVAQSLTLVLAVRIFFNQDGRFLLGLAPTGQLVNLVLALCLLIILVRIPSWISRRIFIQNSSSTITRIIKYAVLSKLTMPVRKAMHLGRGGSGGGKRRVGKAATRALAGKVIAGTVGGPAGTAAATALTAVSAARGGPGPAKHAPTWARRPVRASNWQPAPIKHAPTGPAIQGRYQPTPSPKPPVLPNTPVYGYPRTTYYANGPAGLGQMMALRNRNVSSPSQAIEPPKGQRPVRPIVPPNAPIPGQVEWPENRGRTTPTPPRRRPRKPRGGGSQ
ncbi:conjugal transfer protein TrbL family protein [Nonomuraea angiospora]|uniref:conjugal transfer protein TrbL family protein n=1 Tax=Nonomuraea angiospora TaxID=46172 RepID=UPI0038D4D6E1